MESGKEAYYGFKYLPLIIGAVLISFPVFNYISPEHATVNGEPVMLEFWLLLVILLCGCLLILIFLYFKDSYVMVEIGKQAIRIKDGKEELLVNWIDVESVHLLHFIFPPLYKLRIKGLDDYFLFTTGRSGFQIAGFTNDLSEAGELINKKKGEFGI
ncbi:hypothetical protein D770_24800 [Flammeovirgaceae bacterium 311]|nr:hypothetical protein D770_24800 [Flammeovirgaceae bacterium 311]